MAELEQTIEEKLITQLTQGKSQWTYRPDLNDENKLWDNIRQILEIRSSLTANPSPIPNLSG